MTIPLDHIESLIYFFRGEKIMLDSDLAKLYEVETKILNRAVRRNIKRFPDDFMFQLTSVETSALRFQFGTSKSKGGRRYRPYAFLTRSLRSLVRRVWDDIRIALSLAQLQNTI